MWLCFKCDRVRGVVLAEKTSTTAQYFAALQKFVVLEIGLVLTPCTTSEEVANILAQMVSYQGTHVLNTM